MNASPHIELLDRLGSYLAGDLSLGEFHDWLVETLPDIEQVDDPNAARLAYRIEHRLAEHSGGHITEDELRAALSVLTPPMRTVVVDASIWEMAVSSAATSRSSGTVTTREPAYLAPVLGAPRVAASG